MKFSQSAALPSLMSVKTVTTVIVVVAAATASASSSRSSSSSRAAAATAALEKDHINDYDDIFVQNEAYSKFYDYDNNDDDYDDDDDDDENENENDEDILNDRYQRDYNGRRRRYQRGSSTGIRRKRYPGKNISGNDGINKSRRQRQDDDTNTIQNEMDRIICALERTTNNNSNDDDDDDDDEGINQDHEYDVNDDAANISIQSIQTQIRPHSHYQQQQKRHRRRRHHHRSALVSPHVDTEKNGKKREKKKTKKRRRRQQQGNERPNRVRTHTTTVNNDNNNDAAGATISSGTTKMQRRSIQIRNIQGSGTTSPILAKATTTVTTTSSSIASSLASPLLNKSHPDRTAWKVPSYSNISTMMKNNKKKQSRSSNSSPPSPLTTITTTATVTTANKLTNKPKQKIRTPKSESSVVRMKQPITDVNINKANTSANNANSAATTVAAAARPDTTKIIKQTKSPKKISPATAGSAAKKNTTSMTTPWVRKFLAGRSKDRLLPLPKDYISDNFNLAQLAPIVERIGYVAMGEDAIPVAKALQRYHRRQRSIANKASQQQKQQASSTSSSTSYSIYRRALRCLLREEEEEEEEERGEEDTIIPSYAVQKAAEALYLMIHARFVISPRGLEAIRQVMVVNNTVFGKCPRSACHGFGLLPYGYSNDYTTVTRRTTIGSAIATQNRHTDGDHDNDRSASPSSLCHRYCPSCGEVWTSWDSKTDGCGWGPSFCHLLLLVFGDQVYANELSLSTTTATRSSTVTASPASLSRGVTGSNSNKNNNNSNNINNNNANNDSVSIQPTTDSNNNNCKTNTDDDNADDKFNPIPSVFGFRVHPATSFGRPLRGGSVVTRTKEY